MAVMDSFQTQISRNNYTQIRDRKMTPQEMIAFLENGALYRTFRDVLTDVYPHEDLVPRLAQGLSEMNGTEYNSVQRKVRNWMNGSNTPQNRTQLFQIAFVLGLSEADADRLLASASECGIHYRNPEELVWAYALRTGLSWEQALLLQDEMKPLYEARMQESMRRRTALLKQNTSGGGGATSEAPVTVYTRQLRDDFSDVSTKQELCEFLSSYAEQFSDLHETAYEKFIELLGYLQAPAGGESAQSIEWIVDQYLRMSVPNTKKSGQMTYLQKVIKKNWPTETEITKMKNRTIDVSRKALLLLFLITEDFEFNPEYEEDTEASEWDIYYEDLLEDDPQERLEVRLNQINLFLERYGMNLLDPGNPFDCLVLYALRAEYDAPESMSGNVRQALEVLFEDYEDP